MNDLSSLIVQATQNRGFSPAELAQQTTDKIIHVGDKSHPVIRDQAQAFKLHINAVLTEAFTRMVQEERITMAHRLKAAGYAQLVELLKD